MWICPKCATHVKQEEARRCPNCKATRSRATTLLPYSESEIPSGPVARPRRAYLGRRLTKPFYRTLLYRPMWVTLLGFFALFLADKLLGFDLLPIFHKGQSISDSFFMCFISIPMATMVMLGVAFLMKTAIDWQISKEEQKRLPDCEKPTYSTVDSETVSEHVLDLSSNGDVAAEQIMKKSENFGDL